MLPHKDINEVVGLDCYKLKLSIQLFFILGFILGGSLGFSIEFVRNNPNYTSSVGIIIICVIGFASAIISNYMFRLLEHKVEDILYLIKSILSVKK